MLEPIQRLRAFVGPAVLSDDLVKPLGRGEPGQFEARRGCALACESEILEQVLHEEARREKDSPVNGTSAPVFRLMSDS